MAAQPEKKFTMQQAATSNTPNDVMTRLRRTHIQFITRAPCHICPRRATRILTRHCPSGDVADRTLIHIRRCAKISAWVKVGGAFVRAWAWG